MNIFQKIRYAYFGLYEYYLLKTHKMYNAAFEPNTFLHLKKCFQRAKKAEEKEIDWYSEACGIHAKQKELIEGNLK